MNAAQLMDKQYRYQRYVYDWSRKYYLLGRDSLLKEIKMGFNDNLLEIGCGTARNLRKLAYYYPNNQFYGVDASALMLESARKQLAGSLYESQIHLQQGLAEQLSLNHAPNAQGFDHILLSYVLSMLPQAAPTLQHIIGLVKPGGYLHIVDFADQADLPNWFQGLLKQWLTWFNVHPQLSVMQPLEQSALQQTGVLQKRYIAGRYAVLIHYQKL